MDAAVEDMAIMHPAFAKYKTSTGKAWRKWKYNALYSIARNFTEKYVDTDAGAKLPAFRPLSPEDEEHHDISL